MTKLGQAFLEALCMIPLLMLLVSGVLVLVFWLSLSVLSKHYLYEGLMCSIQNRTYICEARVRKQLQALPLVHVQKVQIYKEESRRAFKVFGNLTILKPFCKSCSHFITKDSAYVPKNYQ